MQSDFHFSTEDPKKNLLLKHRKGKKQNMVRKELTWELAISRVSTKIIVFPLSLSDD